MEFFTAVLERVREVRGMVSASIVGTSTGEILGSISESDSDMDCGIPVMAAAAADLARVITVMTVLLAREELMEDVVLTMTGSYHLLRPLAGADGEGALLFVTLDRERANLALARRHLRDLAAGRVA